MLSVALFLPNHNLHVSCHCFECSVIRFGAVPHDDQLLVTHNIAMDKSDYIGAIGSEAEPGMNSSPCILNVLSYPSPDISSCLNFFYVFWA